MTAIALAEPSGMSSGTVEKGCVKLLVELRREIPGISIRPTPVDPLLADRCKSMLELVHDGLTYSMFSK